MEHSPLPVREDGFTMVELLVSIFVIGVLAAVAIPAFLNQRGAVEISVRSDLKNAATQVENSYTYDDRDNDGRPDGYSTLVGFNKNDPAPVATPGVVALPLSEGNAVEVERVNRDSFCLSVYRLDDVSEKWYFSNDSGIVSKSPTTCAEGDIEAVDPDGIDTSSSFQCHPLVIDEMEASRVAVEISHSLDYQEYMARVYMGLPLTPRDIEVRDQAAPLLWEAQLASDAMYENSEAATNSDEAQARLQANHPDVIQDHSTKYGNLLTRTWWSSDASLYNNEGVLIDRAAGQAAYDQFLPTLEAYDTAKCG